MGYIKIVLLYMFSSQVLFAAGIRTVYVDAKKMQTIFLKMGQSTVLRFREKPKKVVLGNSNYFSVEFIDNDLTIQPQNEVSSNLFVYGEYHTFGFNLKVNPYGQFDDLVNIRWKSRLMPKEKAKRKKSGYKSKTVNKSLQLGKDLIFDVTKVRQNERLNSTIVDIEVENLLKEVIKTKEIIVQLTRSKIRLKNQQFVFRDDEFAPLKKVRLRIIVTPRQRVGFSLEVKFKKKSEKMIISRKYL